MRVRYASSRGTARQLPYYIDYIQYVTRRAKKTQVCISRLTRECYTYQEIPTTTLTVQVVYGEGMYLSK